MGDSDKPRFYGRRRGKKLRPGRVTLVEDLLPKLRVPSGGAPFDPAGLFPDPVSDVWLEIGFGAGEHLADQAQAHPDIGFIGCEPFINGVSTLLAQIAERDLTNIRLHDDDARLLLPRIKAGSVGRVYLLYSDPWPKKRHEKRRLVDSEFLNLLFKKLELEGLVHLATDWVPYAEAVEELFINRQDFVLTPAPKRPETKFERRGRRLGHEVRDLAYRLV